MSPETKEGTLDFMLGGIRHICGNFKRRSPGSESERKAQDYFAGLMAPWADEVKTEEFMVHPNAFMGFIPLAALGGLASVFLFNFGKATPASIIAAILVLIAALMFVFEFLLYRQFVDFLFRKSISKNVYAVRKPYGEVKRRIILGGHADAAWEWTWSYHGQIKTLGPIIFGSVLGLFYCFGVNLAYLAAGTPPLEGAWKVLGLIQFAFIPFYILIMFFINWKVIVDGANDNLTACYAAMGVLKEMSEDDFRFENTEVCCLITGSEEAGLRGAKAFAKKHNEELKACETVFIGLETLRECDQLAVYVRDQTGTVRNSTAAAALLMDAGEAVGKPLKPAGIYPGSTDAAAFTQAGIPAIGLGGVNHDPKRYYHTREDNCENISPECIALSLDIAREAVYLFDTEGLQ